MASVSSLGTFKVNGGVSRSSSSAGAFSSSGSLVASGLSSSTSWVFLGRK